MYYFLPAFFWRIREPPGCVPEVLGILLMSWIAAGDLPWEGGGTRLWLRAGVRRWNLFLCSDLTPSIFGINYTMGWLPAALKELLQSDSKSIVGAGNFGLGTQVGKVLLFYKFIIYLLRWLLLIWNCYLWCKWVPQRYKDELNLRIKEWQRCGGVNISGGFNVLTSSQKSQGAGAESPLQGLLWVRGIPLGAPSATPDGWSWQNWPAIPWSGLHPAAF